MDRPLAPEALRQDRRRRLLRIALPLIALVLLLVWLPGWIRPSVSRDRLRTARVTSGPIEAVIMATGTILPEVERVLSSPLDARVLRILARPGTALKAGTPVVELDVSESVLALEKVVTDLKVKDNEQSQSRLTLEKSLVDLAGKIDVKALDLQTAQARHEGNLQLFKEGLVSREALRQSELAVQQARIQLAQLKEERANAERANKVQLEGLALERGSLGKEAAQARHLLELSTTKSDRDGVLTWVLPQEGAAVKRGDVIARIADLSSFRVDGSVSDVHAGRIRPGMSAVVRVNDRPLEGTISEVFPAVENGIVRFTVALREASHSGLRPSLRAEVLVITDRKPRVLRVKRGPFSDNAARQAFVVRGRRALSTPVTFGLSGLDDVEVVSGLSEGDEVIISDMRDYAHLSHVTIR